MDGEEKKLYKLDNTFLSPEKVAKIIKNSIRDEELVGRYGGEEFIVIIQNKDVKYS